MSKRFNSALVYRVAKYYYIDGLSQNEIARLEDISRSTVSRILDRARESGIVKIEINVPTDELADGLEEKLRDALGIQRVIVVPASVSESSPETEEQLIEDVASVAAAHLPALLSEAKTIGIGWGRTLYKMTPHITPLASDPLRICVPLVGNMTLRNRTLQTSVNVSRFGEALGAQSCYLNISSLRDPSEPYNEFERVNLQQIEGYWSRLDAAIVSLGAPPVLNTLYLTDEMAPDNFSETDRDPAARGEMLSQVFYSDSRASCPISKLMSVVALPLERLREVPVTICVAAGDYKALPVWQAAKNGYFKTLVVDHLLAEKILEISRKSDIKEANA